MFAAPCRSRAIAVHTHESIPPLNSTTAFRPSFISFSPSLSCFRVGLYLVSLLPYLITSFTSFTSSSNSLSSRIPNKLMQLQSQSHRQPIRQNPLHQRARLQTLPLPRRIRERR